MKFNFIIFGIFIFGIINCSGQKINQHDKALQQQALSIFGQLPTNLIDVQKESAKIKLGKKLFLEKKLSINNTISCNSCHKLDQYGVDNESTSPGHDGTRGDRNSPTVYNAALNFSQFWDGRAVDLADQAIGPILNPIEHGLPSEEVAIERLSSKEYLKLFKDAFPKQSNPLKYINIGIAIGQFEKTLLTKTRFDDYLSGDIRALSIKERKGLKKFIETGCTSCHQGPGLGGTSYQKLGLVKPYETRDLGRYQVTKKKRDRYKFKVPLLRNITKTAPYLHDGSIASLDKTIEIMFEYQLGKSPTTDDIEDIKAFLGSLEAKM
ncbi:MAG: cytochrome-c peroxidase [Halobacteriovoraceae bacterium]|nr:cytochrome-c peroxidase [Halobacteriovoraceae bacterium]|tara:strand:+ start:3071 stop:4036 length:966 start_codon:yes stop_codon:yes gene_type:complete